MTIKLEPMRRHAPPPPERPLWRVLRGSQVAEAIVREWEHGRELVITVDGTLRLARLFRADDAGLQTEAATRREQLEAIGFVPAE